MLLRSSRPTKVFFSFGQSYCPAHRIVFNYFIREYSHFGMPEWYPAGGDAFNIIQPCKNLIVRLPSDNYKIVDLKPKRY